MAPPIASPQIDGAAEIAEKRRTLYSLLQRFSAYSAAQPPRKWPVPDCSRLLPDCCPLPEPDVTMIAKELLEACMVFDETKLNLLYAAEVQLLPGNRLFYFGLEVPGKLTEYGIPVERDEMLVALKKQVDRDPMPDFIVSTVVSSYLIEQLDVAAGDFATEPNQQSESLFGSIRFKIEENDVLLRLSVPGAFRFVQLRKSDDRWQVIAEY